MNLEKEIKLGTGVPKEITKKTKIRSLHRKEAIAGYIFALPAILGLLLWTIGPMIASLIMSFTNWKIIGASEWVGFQNYVNIFTNDIYFKKSLWVTFYFAFGSTFFTLLSALIVALLMNMNVKGQSVFRTMYYLPVIVPAVASNILWLWLFNPDFGLLNTILDFLGLPTLMWIYDESTAIPSLILLSVWSCGGTALIFLAGLQDVPKQLLEAVDIDGGNVWHKFRYVTIPTITPVIFFNLIMGLIGAFQAFTQAYVMTEGGPNNATFFYVYLIFREAFLQNNMGYASALAWILFIIIALFTLFIFRSSKDWVHYGGRK
ncbi:carbohydrate ABC transporter permease [Pseudalkalibacillus salsuginis]|uniref:carbohydrate ABC transporter permease n=1 Tax=Pseudalkalibacillus salsuginis TaxID=2910972 RepID=UPI001F1CE516|nr:sugar ABC transporter permease [Pseudalkalibacillus salsuginis]MCF6409099.1 sugar ABC transporter permease [Pseudalkalibacillus salsuginis]